MQCRCQTCKKIIDEGCDNNTCDICIAYIGEILVCEWCNDTYARTNINRHRTSFKYRSQHGELSFILNAFQIL